MGIVDAVGKSVTRAERKAAAGKALEARQKWARRWLKIGNLVEVAGGLRFRYRDQWWPLVVLVVLVVARAWAGWANTAAVAVVSVLGCAVVAFHLRKLPRKREWVYAATCLGGVVLGLVLVSVIGADNRWLNTASVLGWAGLSLIWWCHHEVRDWPGHSKSDLVNRWNLHIRDGKGGMKEAAISAPVPFEHGDTYTIHLVPYAQTLGTAQAELPRISSGLRTPLQNLVLEPHPDHVEDDPTILRLQHVTRSPIKDTVYFDRPRCEDGRIMLGPYADGIGEAFVRLYTENSMWSGFVLGGTGIGKSRLLEQIAVSVLSMGNTVVFYMDGQNGASSSTLFKYADWAVGVDGAKRMLAALERAAKWRQRENKAYGWDGFTPSPSRPGILVIIDEQHLIVPLAPERFANASTEWRKIGQSMLGADQDSGLKTTFKNEDRLRSAMLGGNGLVMNTRSRIAGNLIPGLDINPADLPAIPGYAVLVAAEGSDARTAPFRNRYSPNEREKTRIEAKGTAVSVPTLEEWFERYPNPTLDRGVVRAMGPDYTRRREAAAQEQAELLRFIQGEMSADEGSGADIEAESVDRFESRECSEDVSVTCADRILGMDWESYGQMETAQILAELPSGANLSTAQKALRSLVEAGELQRAERGLYRKSG